MTYSTSYLRTMLEAAYDVEYIRTTADIWAADDAADEILATTYSNADYGYLTKCAKRLREKMLSELAEYQ